MNYAALVTAISDYTENTFPTSAMNTFIRQAEQRIYNTIQFPSLRKNVTGAITANNKYVSCPEDFLAPYSLAVYPAAGGDYTFLLNKDVNFIREAYPNPTSTGAPKYYALFGPTVSAGTITNELSLILGPTPDTTYNTELHYYYYPESIVQGVVTSLTSVNASTGVPNGVYTLDMTAYGTGSGLTVSITVVNNAPTSIIVLSGGSGYAVGELVSGGDYNFGLTAYIGTVSNASGTTWLGDNFDSVLLYGSLVEAYTYMKGEQDIIGLYDAKFKDAIILAKRLGDGMERQDAYRSGQYRQQVT